MYADRSADGGAAATLAAPVRGTPLAGRRDPELVAVRVQDDAELRRRARPCRSTDATRWPWTKFCVPSIGSTIHAGTLVVIQHGSRRSPSTTPRRRLGASGRRRQDPRRPVFHWPHPSPCRGRCHRAVLPDRRARLRVGLAHRAAAAPRERDRDRRLLAVVLDPRAAPGLLSHCSDSATVGSNASARARRVVVSICHSAPVVNCPKK